MLLILCVVLLACVGFVIFNVGRALGRAEGAAGMLLQLLEADFGGEEDDEGGGEDEPDPAPILPPDYAIGQRWSARQGHQ